MEQIDFEATFIALSYENGVYTLGLSDDEFDYDNYFIIQVSCQYSAQDIETNQEYFESSMFDGGVYGSIDKIILNFPLITLEIKRDSRISNIKKICVKIIDQEEKELEIASFIRDMFSYSKRNPAFNS